MNGKLRAFLLILLTLAVLGAIGAMVYFVRGFDGLPTLTELLKRPKATQEHVIETPPPTAEPTPGEEPLPLPTPEALPEPSVEATAAPAAEDEDVISSLSGVLHTGAGDMRYRSEILQAGSGQEGGTLGHVYSSFGQIRLRFTAPDGSALQEPVILQYAGEDLHQEARCADLDGDGSEELVIRLHTFENEHTVLLFALDPESGAFRRVHFTQSEGLTWSSDFDAATGQIWYRHNTDPLQYDCYELQGLQLVLVRRLEDSRRSSAEERFSEYVVDGDRLLTVQEKVPASAIDRGAWSFVNFE